MRYVLGTVGAVVGFIAGGPSGAVMGFNIGYTAGTYVDPHDTRIDGQKLDSLKVQDSSYGGGIPKIFGTMRTAGNIIWSTDLIQHEKSDTNKGGKGSGDTQTQVTYSYTSNFALAICEGEIDEVVKVWADGKVLYENGQCSRAAAVRIYSGTEDQLPDPLIEANLGEGNAPAYRGTAYIVFEELQLADFGNRIPNITCLVVSGTMAVLDPVVTIGEGRPAQVFGERTTTPIVASNGSIATFGETSGMLSMRTYSLSGEDIVANTSDLESVASEAEDGDIFQDVSSAGRVAICGIDNDPGTLFKIDLTIFDPVSRTAVASLTTSIPEVTGWAVEDVYYEAATRPYVKFGWTSDSLLVLQLFKGASSGYAFFRFNGSSIESAGFVSCPSGPRFALPTIPEFVLSHGGGHIYSQRVRDVSGVVTVDDEVVVCAADESHFNTPELFSINQNEYLILGNDSAGAIYALTLRQVAHVLTASRDEDMLCDDSGFKYAGAWIPSLAQIAIVGINHDTDGATYSEVLLPEGSFSLKTDAEPITIAGSAGKAPRVTAYTISPARFDLVVTTGTDLYYLKTYTSSGSADVGSIVQTACVSSGYREDEINVSALFGVKVRGFMWSPSAGRTVIDTLRSFYPFDLIESDGFLKGVVRTSNVTVEISEDELAAQSESSDAGEVGYTLVRTKELDLPRSFIVSYLDEDREWQSGTQRATRQSGGGLASSNVTLPIVMTPLEAKQLAEQKLFTAWGERDSIQFKLPGKYIKIDPSDVISIGPLVARMENVKFSNGVVECTATPIWTAAYSGGSKNADTGKNTTREYTAPGPSTPFILDIPPLRASDDEPGCYAAVGSTAEKWPGAAVVRAPDGVEYIPFGPAPARADFGSVADALAPGLTEAWDNANTIDVVMSYGELSSVTELQVLNGYNSALLGDEIIQFQNAELIAEKTYRLSKLLRGRRGTEHAVSTHVDNDRFIALLPNSIGWKSLPLHELGSEYDYKAVTNGTREDDAVAISATVNGNSILPLSPVHISGRRTGDDVEITWIRRARINQEWNNFADVPLDEPVESYEIDILNGSGDVVRTIAAGAEKTASYSSADQIADFGSVQTHIPIRIYQISSRIGRGRPGEAIV